MPIRLPEAAGKPYRPSNGTEGMMFEEQICSRCRKNTGDDLGCQIFMAAFFFEIGHPHYPKEWVFDEEGCPKCTALEEET